MPLKPTTAMRKDRAAGQVKMQHRHFAFIAGVIASMRADGWNEQVAFHVADRFADALGKTNPNFDRTRFLTASSVADPAITQAAYPERTVIVGSGEKSTTVRITDQDTLRAIEEVTGLIKPR